MKLDTVTLNLIHSVLKECSLLVRKLSLKLLNEYFRKGLFKASFKKNNK